MQRKDIINLSLKYVIKCRETFFTKSSHNISIHIEGRKNYTMVGHRSYLIVGIRDRHYSLLQWRVVCSLFTTVVYFSGGLLVYLLIISVNHFSL